MSKIKIISWIIQAYLLVMRGTPLILQLIFFYFAPDLIGIHLTRFQAAIVAFTLNYAAYFAEIYRGGIESVPLGQREAANVLGLSRTHTFFRIVLPQVVQEGAAAHEQRIHDSGQGYRPGPDIGVAELFQFAQSTSSRTFSILPIFVAGIFYLVMNAVVNLGFNLAEKKFNYYT